MHNAVHFQAISQGSKHDVNLVSLSELRDENDDPTVLVLKAMEAIGKLKAEVILLYTKKEIIKLFLQQVILCCLRSRLLSLLTTVYF